METKKKESKITPLYLLKLISGCIVSALMYAICIKCFIQLDGYMLTGGVGGIGLIFSRLLGQAIGNTDLIYSIFIVVVNIPLFFLGYKKIGKLYAIFSLVNVVISAIFNYIIPTHAFDFVGLTIEKDRLLIAIIAGVLNGVKTGIALDLGSSTGGLDIITTYLGIRYNKPIGNYNFIINAAILVCGGLVFGHWDSLLYSIIFIFMSSQLVDLMYKRTEKVSIKVITDKKEEMSKVLLENSRHGGTIYECEGLYSHTKRYTLETIVLEGEYKNIIDKIMECDPSAFISARNIRETKGRYRMPSFK